MNNDESELEAHLGQALDHALRHTLRAPDLPANFHARLNTALAAYTGEDVASRRGLLEREYQQQLSELQQGYLRLRWRTLGTLIGAAFASGVTVALAMPWLQEIFGVSAIYAPTMAAILFALVASARSCMPILERLLR